MSRNIGIAGLGTMGTMVGRRLARQGYALSLHNRRVENIEENIAQSRISNYPEFADALGFEDIQAFVESIEAPRIIIITVNAGTATETVIDEVTPFLQPGDCIVDGGNA